MRKLFWALSLTLLVAALTIGQTGSDDHDDAGPIQSGYVVITPSSPSTTGLVAMETFGLRKGGLPGQQAGLAAPTFLTSASMFVDVSSDLRKDVGIAIVNPNAASVDIILTLRRDNGTLLATRTITLATRRQLLQFVTQIFAPGTGTVFSVGSALPNEFIGTMLISSNSPIYIMGLRFRSDNFSTMPVNVITASTFPIPFITSGVGGIGAFLFPHFATGGGWASELVVSNLGSTSATVRLDFFKSDGSSMTVPLNGTLGNSFTNQVIPAGGVLVFAQRDRFGDDDF